MAHHNKCRPFQVRTIQKKMQSLEGQFDCCTEQLFEVGLKLEQKEKVFHCGFFHFGFVRFWLLWLEFALDFQNLKKVVLIPKGV